MSLSDPYYLCLHYTHFVCRTKQPLPPIMLDELAACTFSLLLFWLGLASSPLGDSILGVGCSDFGGPSAPIDREVGGVATVLSS